MDDKLFKELEDNLKAAVRKIAELEKCMATPRIEDTDRIAELEATVKRQADTCLYYGDVFDAIEAALNGLQHNSTTTRGR